MPIAKIHRISYWFDHALRGLAVAVPKAEVERFATLVHQCMEAKTRTYHTAFHVLGLCEGMQPIQILAALFHDVVFYQVDGGLPTCVSDMLEAVTVPEPGFLRLLEIAPEDRVMSLCVDIFGFHAGQRLSTRHGMNEFLSAVVAARLLQGHLSESQLMAVVACIELTIPFRAPDAKGKSAAQRLALRIQARCGKLAADLVEKEPPGAAFVNGTVTSAVELANQDVTGFIEASPEYCLINSMLLVEESMMPQAASGKRSLLAYRGALLGMETFLSQLNPAWVVQSFEGHPAADGVKQMQATARQNIDFVLDYLAAVLNSVAIVEALAKSAGIGGPLARSLVSIDCSVGARFPGPLAGSLVHPGLHQLLKNGLAERGKPGLDAVPLAACVYGLLGPDTTQQSLQRARQMFGGTLSPGAFLQHLDRGLVFALIRHLADIDPPHKEAFLVLEHRLYADSAAN